MRRIPQNLQDVVEPAIAALGYELVGVEYNRQPKNSLLRVYIDSEDGITLEDCERASHQLSGVLDVEDTIPGRYTLEISSPGLDRPLFTAQHYERFAGRRARIRLAVPLQGRRTFTGILHGVDGTDVLLEVDDHETRIALDSIEQARLVPEY